MKSVFEQKIKKEVRQKTSPTKSTVVFKVGGQDFGIELKNVVSVKNRDEVLADGPNGALGKVETKDGRTLPVLDLAKRLRLDKGRNEKKMALVVETGDLTMVLVVDEVRGVREVPRSQLENLPERIKNTSREGCIEKLIKGPDGICLLLDPELILKDQEKRELIKAADTGGSG